MNLLNGGSFTASALMGGLAGLPSSSTMLGYRDVIIDKDGMVEIPGKGWCWVYLARYSYDPFQHSPNDTPEAELAINAGDYILVWSDPDEDGFFDGEIIDGRKGLVPSNFVERLEGDDLIEFYQSVVMGIGDGDDSICTSIPQDLDFISSDEGLEETRESRGKYFTSRKATLSHYYASCTDLDMTEDESGLESPATSDYIPPPKHLTLETQLNRSLLVGWTAPDCLPDLVESYQVLLDGEVQATVKATETSLKAAITPRSDGVGRVHRVSVKTLGTNRKSSNEAGCTMLFGKEAPLGPTALRVSNVRTTSATVSWMPSNSNFLHTLCLNNVEVRTVKQGVFRHSIAGLTPNTPYRITVRAKNIKAMAAQSASWTGGGNVTKQLDTLSSHIEIRTLPQGLPDPPLDVQVDAGPEPGTLNVLWLPVTITQFGLSNGAPVTGYVVYADGESVQDIDDPTADCATISLSKVRGGTIKAVSVRTKSKDKLSVDSSSCPVPSCFLGEARDVVQPSQPAAAAQVQHPAAKSTKAFAVDDLDSADEDSETELLEKLQARTGISNTINSSNNTNTGMSGSRQRELIINYSGYPELDSDIGPSELSGRKNAFYITLNFCTYRSIYFSSFIFLKRDCGAGLSTQISENL
jgi:RIMS-binding protein 2